MILALDPFVSGTAAGIRKAADRALFLSEKASKAAFFQKEEEKARKEAASEAKKGGENKKRS